MRQGREGPHKGYVIEQGIVKLSRGHYGPLGISGTLENAPQSYPTQGQGAGVSSSCLSLVEGCSLGY